MFRLDQELEGALRAKGYLPHDILSRCRGDESEMLDFFLELTLAINHWLSWSFWVEGSGSVPSSLPARQRSPFGFIEPLS